MNRESARIDEAVLNGADRPVVVRDNHSISNRDLRGQIENLCCEIQEKGAKRIAVIAQPCERVITAIFAAQRLGVDIVLIRKPWDELQLNLERWGVDHELGEDNQLIQLHSPTIMTPHKVIVITTSGTTGDPKAVAYTLSHLIGRIARPAKHDPRTRWLLAYNPASFAGLQVILTAIIGGSTICVPAGFDVVQVSNAAAELRPTHVSATPTLWRGMLMLLGDHAAQIPLVRITLGGEAADQDILTRLNRTFPDARISHIYASTEAGALFAVQDGRAGFPASWLETGVEGTSLQINASDVLEVSTQRGMDGYLDAESPAGKWIVTGDVVKIVGDRVVFVGREDSVINVGGAKVWPETVEDVLRMVPGVAEAQVYGKRNPIMGSVVVADLVLHASANEAEVIKACREHAVNTLQRHEVPQRLSVVQSIVCGETNKKARTP